MANIHKVVVMASEVNGGGSINADLEQFRKELDDLVMYVLDLGDADLNHMQLYLSGQVMDAKVPVGSKGGYSLDWSTYEPHELVGNAWTGNSPNAVRVQANKGGATHFMHFQF